MYRLQLGIVNVYGSYMYIERDCDSEDSLILLNWRSTSLIISAG